MAQAQIETVANPKDKIMLVLSWLLLVAGVLGFYLLVDMAALVQWGVLGLGLLLAVATFLLSSYGRTFLGYSKSSWNEVKKVVWPERKETVQNTLFVFVFVVVLGIFMLIVDKVVGWVLYDLILGWGNNG